MSMPIEAEVLATFGRGLLLQLADGSLRPARPFGRRLVIVCGDRVTCDEDAHGELLVREVLERRSALWRTNGRGDGELIAANLDRLCVVLAPRPEPDFFIVDRYLCAARSASLEAAVVVNKCDLPLSDGAAGELANYTSIGYPVMTVGARDGVGVTELGAALAGVTAALVGQSGVGKSSLIRGLAADGADALTGSLMRDEAGRHTTTASRRYTLHGGGGLIDSPGVRDFAPSIDHLEAGALGFVEVAKLAPGCRFADCRHMEEPKCAVRDGVDAGGISERRYESYRRLRRLSERLRDARPPGQRRR
ncbi:MAG: ribosome small subunit-dependent GTPase A [Steroidobacteraceae bacterium]